MASHPRKQRPPGRNQYRDIEADDVADAQPAAGEENP